MAGVRKTVRKSFRMTEAGDYILQELCARMGLKEPGVIEQALRELAKREGVPIIPPVGYSSSAASDDSSDPGDDTEGDS